ncbi:MAG: PCP reductase family protein [Gemmatimonadota bacterium]
MKFLCIPCDEVMVFSERRLPGDGTMAAIFLCDGCRREMALLTNPMETQLVSTMGVKVGGREVPAQPMETVRGSLEGGKPEAFQEEAPMDAVPELSGAVVWTEEARTRLQSVPNFVRGMVKRIYTDYAREHGIATISPEVMDRARTDLGLEGM